MSDVARLAVVGVTAAGGGWIDGSIGFIPKVTCINGFMIRYMCMRKGKEKLTFSDVEVG